MSKFSKNFFRFSLKIIEITNANNKACITMLFSNFSDKNKAIPANKQKTNPVLFIIKLIFLFII